MPAVVDYLKSLGITAVELLPIHGFVDDRTLVSKGLRNYWGYNSIAYFAPDPLYVHSPTGALGEFKTMVQVLHNAGIEVILDVVYNHTAEGNELGPTFCFRGIDNASYYRLLPQDSRRYTDFTGCGNAFNLHHPRVLQLVMDSLRYWVREMHVDGFRFDLATVLARNSTGAYDTYAGFLDAILQDPVLSGTKLIAEPWDVGDGGYQVGNFPPGWSEWNDRYRDTVRRFWKGERSVVPELAFRLTGSSDMFERRGRRPWESLNFVTAHDGFTLNDLVSYEIKRNEANNENNRDGTDNNFNWNCGVEGPTKEPKVLKLRRQQMRNMLTTLFLSQGVPMMVAGDEIARTQQGNNNSYCQDNEISWLDWTALDDPEIAKQLDFVRRVIHLRRRHFVFHRYRFFHGRKIPGSEYKDITWLLPDGGEFSEKDWHQVRTASIAFMLSGEAGLYHLTARGEPEPDDTFFVILNAEDDDLSYKLPHVRANDPWELVIDTSIDDGFVAAATAIDAKAPYTVKARSSVVLVSRRKIDAED